MYSLVYKRMGGGVDMGSGPSLFVKLGGPRFDDERALRVYKASPHSCEMS